MIHTLPSLLRFLAAHTLASLLSLGIFMVPLLLPYTPYATYINWHAIFPYLKPFAIGLGVSIWLLAALPVLAIHALIRMAGLHHRQDYILIGATAGLALSMPVLKLMGTSVVNTDITPLITPGWLLANQIVYALAWTFSGAAFGFSYHLLHSESHHTSSLL